MARKYYFNEDYFEKIDTESKAYFLGLLMADGYIATTERFVTIALKNEDAYILEKLKKEVNSEAPLGNKKKCTQKVLTLCSKKMVNDLKNLGLTRNKTFTLKFPNIKTEYIRHFIRGYFDGDGYIGERQCTLIISSPDFLNTFLDFFQNKFGKNLYFHEIKNSYRVNLNRRDNDVVNFIYKDAHIYLNRKYNNYKKYWKP